MLFRKDIEPRCAYCARGCRINEEEVLCRKRGIVSPEFRCRAFRYDPLLREPPAPIKLRTDKLTEEDFKI
jgi:hypothetical protein